MNNFEDCPPNADAMVHSMRAFGYDLGTAIADLIDNSIFAGATEIRINYSWNNGDPWVAILDDGKGMTDKELYNAMRPGSRSPKERRDANDLGRFGLGLKTASWSQGKYLVVATRKSQKLSSRFWDLDHVDKQEKWSLGKKPASKYLKLIEPLKKQPSGTIVVWGQLDRLIDSEETDLYEPEAAFNHKFVHVKQYLEMVFHQYLSASKNKLTIRIGAAKCQPWDPYMVSNDFTQKLYGEKYEDSRVSVVPFILPHVSHRTLGEKEYGGGINGWNAQQGFYIYRNKRMIVSGGWLGLEDLTIKDEYRLARIKIEITNDMDHEWELDVKKAEASPPDRLRNELARIARKTRANALAIYKARIGSSSRTGPQRIRAEIWVKERKGDKIVYRLNQNHPVLKKFIDESGAKKTTINNLCYLMESTMPHREIIMDDRQDEDCHVDLPEDISPPPVTLIEFCIELYKKEVKEGREHEEAVDLICNMQPFNIHPLYRVKLDCLQED